MHLANFHYRLLICLAVLMGMAGCNSSDGESVEAADNSTGVTGSATETAPAIWGKPKRTAVVGAYYSFTPEYADDDGDVLEFAITNKPAWADFSRTTGELRGTPASVNLGRKDNIVISVTDRRSVIALPSFSITVGMEATPEPVSTGPSAPPTISGSPNKTAIVDAMYAFQPEASDPDDDSLSFSVVGKPSWASFDTTTGRLEGRPGAGDVGVTDPIRLSATDGDNMVGLADFRISVEAAGVTSFTVAWSPPTENEDGTPLTDLAGYRIYYGTTSGSYTEVIELNSPGVSSYVIENLGPGTYFLVMTSVNDQGMESEQTPEISFELGT